MALVDNVIISSTDGERLDARNVWGIQYIVTSNALQTRDIVPPSAADQRMKIVAGAITGGITIDAPSGQDFDGDGGDQILLQAVTEWIVLESFKFADGTYEWRVVAKHADVEVA